MDKLRMYFKDYPEKPLTFEWLDDNDLLAFEWDETRCGDTDYYETRRITLKELFNLLRFDPEGRVREMADRQAVEMIDSCKEREQSLIKKLRETTTEKNELQNKLADIRKAIKILNPEV